ncbi:hypothetical protein F4813DRAFT_399147, partial [Daldinia decipiens]|uniref:uncharacterized protein n=1 Tax=Daldinia decipiens TaxID=326647 RepID=UPI0020C53C70
FLFRSFCSSSGGGYSYLNTTTGIIPHSFLNGETPTTIYDIYNLKQMIDGHLCGFRVRSAFSSWAADLHIAIRFLRDQSGYIAIIDTKILMDYVKIYHVKALFDAGLASGLYDHEYLVYGPITGPAYHCVKYLDITRVGLYLTSMGACLRSIPNAFTPVSTLSEGDMSRLMIQVREVALLFRRPGDSQLDAVIAVAAIIIGDLFGITSSRDIEYFYYSMLRYFPHELQVFQSSTVTSIFGRPRLVNPKTYTTPEYPQLKHAINALRALEYYLCGVS